MSKRVRGEVTVERGKRLKTADVKGVRPNITGKKRKDFGEDSLRGAKRIQQNYYRGILSNYCGPGGFGLPQHETDQACQEHDIDYGKISAAEGFTVPYTEYNWADEKFIQKLKKITPKSKREAAIRRMGMDYFQFKKLVRKTLNKTEEEHDDVAQGRLDPEAKIQDVFHNKSKRKRDDIIEFTVDAKGKSQVSKSK